MMPNEIKERVLNLQRALGEKGQTPITVMEVCGTHTMSLARNGIRAMLPPTVKILSGPGCPVCVTASGEIQAAIDLAERENVIVCTFGDMLKVPGKKENLSTKKNVRVVYSPIESLTLAKENPNKEIVFLGIGFETTAPLIASTIEMADEEGIGNFSVLSMHKLVPPAMNAIFSDPSHKIDALLLPGHVSAITGRRYFDFILKAEVSGVIAGFETLDVMEALYLLVCAHEEKRVILENNYPRAVSEHGNLAAQQVLARVFTPADSVWRGIGMIPASGLKIKNEFATFDTEKKLNIKICDLADPPGCRCGDILMGKVTPRDCKLFGKTCTPSAPVGPCMVSSEGTCAAYFKYRVGESDDKY